MNTTMRFYADEPIKADDVIMIDPLRPDRVRKARFGMLAEWQAAVAGNDADKDGVVVVTHDANLQRIAGVDKNVSDLTYDELQTYDAGSWFSNDYKGLKVATLDEALKLCKGKVKVNIELKDADNKPDFILNAYKNWISNDVANKVVIPYISMHGSTEAMVTHLVSALDARGIEVHPFDLSVTDIGELAMALVDAATIVIGTPTVLFGPHPLVFSATHLANALRPKLRFAAIIGSYGWGTKAAEQLTELIPHLKVDVLGVVMCKGFPREEDIKNLDTLAQNILEQHRGLEKAVAE